MAVLHVLGSGAAYSDGGRTTTMLALEGDAGVVVVDCGGDVIQRVLAHGLDPLAINALIVTHEHADHVSGLPLMMERLWLAGRRSPLPVIGIEPAVDQAIRAHDAFDTSRWTDYPGIAPRSVAHEVDVLLHEDRDWRITASPGTHAVPVVGLRCEANAGAVIAYSSDTAYDARIVDLARDADLLVHEASGASPVHASACEAARVAVEANAGRLVLVHLPPDFDEHGEDMRCARSAFAAVEAGFDGAKYAISAR
jgi:ribonuclease Z